MNERHDVAYGTGNGRELRLDIYEPDEALSQRTAVLMFHGGGWRRGDRKNLAAHARLMQSEGFTAIAVEYRLLDESPWPSAVHDVRAAIRWARAHAPEINIDPARIALESFSAGAHLSLIAAGTTGVREFEGDGGNPGIDTSVAAVVAFYPPTLLHIGEERIRGSSPATNLLGESADAEAARKASPRTYVSPTFPPVFLLHGGADRIVPASSSFAMYEALREAGVEADLHIFAGQNHAFDSVEPFRNVVAKEVSLFLRRMVSERELIAQQVLEQSPFARAQAQMVAGGKQ